MSVPDDPKGGPKWTLDAYAAILHTHWRSGFRTGLVTGWVFALSAALLWAWLA